MECLLNSYLERCSKTTNAKGYTGLEKYLPRIRDDLVEIYGEEKVLDNYIKETLNHCNELTGKGVRIFDWWQVNEKELKERLENISINNFPQ